MALIAIDAMGGDHAPAEIVLGALDAVEKGAEVVLVGDESQLEPLLRDAGVELAVVNATEMIGMADDLKRAIREKKDASIIVAARLVASGDAAGMVSAGATGATMAAAVFVLGRLPDVQRPAIASIFPTGKIVLDSGANLEARPEYLMQFALMGTALAETYLNLKAPRVGLLNIGEEEGKGRKLEKAAYELMAAAPGIDFVGNVEGTDLDREDVDVFVTDGFTGNVLLKTAEGTAAMVVRILNETLAAPQLAESVELLASPLQSVRDLVDVESHGGGHLVGTKGVVVIAHGSSSRVAIANAVRLAAEGAEHGLVEKMTERLAAAATVG